jgi:hypothetical protein
VKSPIEPQPNDKAGVEFGKQEIFLWTAVAMVLERDPRASEIAAVNIVARRGGNEAKRYYATLRVHLLKGIDV